MRKYLKRALQHGDFRCRAQHLETLRQRLHRPSLVCWWGYYRNCMRWGCTPAEYIVYTFYRRSRLEKSNFILYANTDKCYAPLVSAKERHFLKNKVDFNRRFDDFIRRQWLYCPDHSPEEIAHFIERFRPCIAKPTSRNGGRGIFLVDESQIADKGAFVARLKKDGILLEERLAQHAALARLNPTSVNTVRPVCVKDGRGKVHFVAVCVRVGGEGAVVDNFYAGGIAFPLDPASGRVAGCGIDAFGREYSRIRGIEMSGFQIPHWDQLKACVERAMHLLPETRLVGWDICVMEDGVAIVEGNNGPSPISFQLDGVGKRALFQALSE